jgi:hypothetical protein
MPDLSCLVFLDEYRTPFQEISGQELLHIYSAFYIHMDIGYLFLDILPGDSEL